MTARVIASVVRNLAAATEHAAADAKMARNALQKRNAKGGGSRRKCVQVVVDAAKKRKVVSS